MSYNFLKVQSWSVSLGSSSKRGKFYPVFNHGCIKNIVSTNFIFLFGEERESICTDSSTLVRNTKIIYLWHRIDFSRLNINFFSLVSVEWSKSFKAADRTFFQKIQDFLLLYHFFFLYYIIFFASFPISLFVSLVMPWIRLAVSLFKTLYFDTNLWKDNDRSI